MGRFRFAALSIGLGAVIGYLAVHAVTGRQGLVAYMDLQEQQRDLSAELDTLQSERTALETRAERLRPDSLDLDYLDERARASLAAGDPDELVFTIEPNAI
ncbi:MAG: septum formation initiator family protein [Hyphomonadaceae bacterium]